MKPTLNARPDPASPAATLAAADALLDALPLGVLMLDEQRIVRRVNQQAARWCGAAPEALVGRPLAEAGLPPAVGAALGPLLEAGEAAPREVYLPEHEAWLSFSAARQPGGWVLYGQDITPQRQHEAEALRRQDELARGTTDQYHALFHSMDQGFCVLKLQFDDAGQHVVDFRYQQLNPVFSQQSGIPEGAQGKTAREVMPDLESFWFDTYCQVALTGESMRLEHYVPQVGRWFDVHTFRVGAPVERQIGVLFYDITVRKQAEEQLRLAAEADAFRLRLADALAPLTDPVAIQEAVTRLTRQHFRADHCHYGEIEGGQVIIRRDAMADGLPSVAGTYPLADFALLQAAIAAGRPSSVRDVRADESMDEALRQVCVQLQVISFLNVPIAKNGQATGLLCLAQRVPRDWTAAEATLTAEVAERTWAAMERARVENALTASEEKYRTLFNSIDEGFIISELLYDEQGRPTDALMLETNPSYDRITRTTGAAGRRAKELFPASESIWFETYGRVLETGESVRFENYFAPLDSWIELYVTRVGGAGSRRFASIFNDVTARKRHEASLAFLSEVSQDLVDLTDPDATMPALCAKVGAHFGAGVCAFSPVDEAAGTVAVQYVWHRPDAVGLAGVYRLDDYHRPEVQQAMRAGRPEVVRDTAAELPEAAARLAALRIGAFVNLPFVREGMWVFILSITASEPRDWRPDELALLHELAARVWTRLERARAEEALAASEAQLRNFVAASADVLYRMDAGWQHMLHLDGRRFVPDTAASSTTWLDTYIPPPDQPVVAATIRAAIAGPHFFELEHRVFQVDGSVGWTFSRAVPVLNRRGELVEWFGTATDITARKHAEEALRLSQQQLAEFSTGLEQQVAERTQELRQSRDLLHAIAESQSAYITAFQAVRDEHGRIVDLEYVFVNANTEQLAGGRPLVGRTYLEVFPEVESAGFLGSYRRVIETGLREDRELAYADDQVTGWFRSNATKLGDGVLVVGEDITARKQAEQERLRTLRLLEQAETVAGLGSWDYDLLTREFFWSEGMYRLFGLPPGEAVEPRIYLDYVVEEDRPRAERLVHCLTTGSGDVEDVIRLQIGAQIKTVHFKSVVLSDAAGQPVRMLGVDLDISQLQRLEADNLRLRLTQQQALFEAVQAAQEAERKRMAESLHNGIGQMLYATKLHLDRLHAPLLGADAALAAARHEADQLLGEAIRQTRTLSHELVPLVLEEFGLATALRDIGGKMSTPQLRLRCQVLLDEDAAPLAPALQMALYRMAQELAQNVVKHARGATAASLELETMPGWALLRAEDNGAGFAGPPADSPGLGLRSIRDRVALLGGQLDTGAVPTGGAFVRIRIPLPSPITSAP